MPAKPRPVRGQSVEARATIDLRDDARDPWTVIAAARAGQGFPCWSELVAVAARSVPGAVNRAVPLTGFAAPAGWSRGLDLVAYSSRSSPLSSEVRTLATIAALLAGAPDDTFVLFVRDRFPCPAEDLIWVDADGWEAALAVHFERIATQRWVWSCACPSLEWEVRFLDACDPAGAPTGTPERPPEDVSAEPPLTSQSWMGGAVFFVGGLRSVAGSACRRPLQRRQRLRKAALLIGLLREQRLQQWHLDNGTIHQRIRPFRIRPQ